MSRILKLCMHFLMSYKKEKEKVKRNWRMGSKRNCDSLKLKILKPILKQIRGRVDCLYEIL